MLVPILVSAAADDDATQRVWCQQSAVLDLAECRDTAPPDGPDWVVVLERNSCVGVPGEGEQPPECIPVVLRDFSSHLTVEGDCVVTATGGKAVVQRQDTLAAGTVAVPVWAQDVTVSCPGYVDVRLAPSDAVPEIEVEPGREVVVTLVGPALDGDEDATEPRRGRVAIEGVDSDFSHHLEVRLGDPLSFGGIPLGSYTVTASADGSAPVVDSFLLMAAEEPLELRFQLPESRCVPVDVACDKCKEGGISFRLQRLSSSKAPVAYLDGALPLTPTDASSYHGEICGVGDGSYELTLAGPSVTPVSMPVDVGSDGAPVFFELREGLPSRLSLVDTDGLPVAGATIRVRWRVDGHPQEAETTSDAAGEVRLPPLPPRTVFRARIDHDATIRQVVEGTAGDERVVLLMPRGAVSARIVGDACAPDAEIVATIERRVDPGRNSGREDHSPEDCVFDIPVENPGTYDVDFHGPGFVSHHEEVTMEASQTRDLGDIELERGDSFRVKVAHDGAGVAGAEVRIGREGVPVFTDGDGLADFHTLDPRHESPHQVELFVAHPSYAPRRVLRSVAADDEVMVDLNAGAEIYGVVLSDDGSPAVGESVYAGLPDGHVFAASVSGTGEYRITRLEPGTWMVYRMKTFTTYGTVGTGFGTSDSQMVTLTDGMRREVNFLPTVEIRGRVSVNGETVDHAFKMGAVQSGAESSSAVAIDVDSSGFFTARLPRPGMWTFLYYDLTYTQEIAGCPCVVDVLFTGTPPSSGEKLATGESGEGSKPRPGSKVIGGEGPLHAEGRGTVR
jgi:hypothetical protein